MKKQIHIVYSGKVQGVGFRFGVRDLAGALDVTGWVRNLADGSVEVTAEADDGTLDIFLSKISQSFEGYIKSTDMEEKPAKGEFKDFQIRF